MGNCFSAPDKGQKLGKRTAHQSGGKIAHPRQEAQNVASSAPVSTSRPIPTQGPGRSLNENSAPGTGTSPMSPQQAAFAAAQEREQKNQKGSGKLSNKLANERKQNRTQLLTQSSQKVQEPLIYD